MSPQSPESLGLPFRSQFGDRAGGSDDRPSAATLRQSRVLGSSEAAQVALRRQVDRVQDRRRRRSLDGAPIGGEVDFEIVGRGRAEPLLVVNELLMWAVDVRGETDRFRQGAAALLAEQELEPTPIDELAGRVVRIQRKGRPLPVDALRTVAARLRELGYPASLTTVTPLGPILKGEGAAEPAPGLAALTDGPKVQEAALTVAVIDSGVTAKPRTDGWLAEPATPTDIDPLDAFPVGAPDGFLDFGAGHGTFVAGIVRQVAPAARVQVYRAVDSDGIGSEVDVAKAMLRAAEDGARILNLSLGSETEEDQPPLAIRAALDLLAELHPDVLVVAAAGNSDSTAPSWPAAFRDVVSVGALGVDRQRASFSNHGPWVDCAAIGAGVLSTYVEGVENPFVDPAVDPTPDTFEEDPWATWSGTSFSAPQIAAAVARACLDDPSLTPRRALTALLAQGVPMPGLGIALEILPGS